MIAAKLHPLFTLPVSEAKQHEFYRRWLSLIIVISVLLRVAVAFLLGNQVTDLPGTFDQLSYDMLAQQVMNGHGFTVIDTWWPATPAGEPTAHWSYLYTGYLVVIYTLFGYYPLIARLIQALLTGIFMPWLAYRIGRRHYSPQVGLVAAALAAIYIYFIYYAGNLMTETFYITAILWSMDVSGQLVLISEKKPLATILRYGLLLGLALSMTVLLRQVFLLFIPILSVWLLWCGFRQQFRLAVQAFQILAIAGIITILSIAPWTYRNYQAFDEFVLLNTNAGFAFFWGNHPIHGYNFISILPNDGPSYGDLIPDQLRSLNEAKLDRALLKEGVGFVKADPGRYLILSITRIRDYFKFWPSSDSSLFSNVSRVLSFGILWPFMAYGFFVTLRRAYASGTIFMHLFIVVYTALHLLTWALTRYRLPVDAILIVFAGFAIVQLYNRLTHRQAIPISTTARVNG
jgi:hypothetical protein